LAKGQQRSNREVKKPKKDKPKASAPTTGNPFVTIEKMQAREALAKKKK
jgi:hypothetical protein